MLGSPPGFSFFQATGTARVNECTNSVSSVGDYIGFSVAPTLLSGSFSGSGPYRFKVRTVENNHVVAFATFSYPGGGVTYVTFTYMLGATHTINPSGTVLCP
jgi:hypothetical protein